MADAPESSVIRGNMEETTVEGFCPDCGETGLVIRSMPLNIPFFGNALQTTLLCPHCSFRHPDLLLANEGRPTRWEMRVDGRGDLEARVVRSSNGTVRIPELGIAMEPGFRPEAFVSNAEGVLLRMRDIIAFSAKTAETEAARRRGERTLKRTDDMIAGHRPFTLVLEDPAGNSAILHPRAKRWPLTEKQAARLKRVPEFRAFP